MPEKEDHAQSDDLERALARTISWALPAGTVLVAIGIGVLFGVGPGILVLAAGALVGVIGLLWASLRTLGGDAPLAEGLATAAAVREKVSGGAERKRRVLLALKDLEHEHSVGKIDDEDYAELSGRYREQAKEILREMDVEIEPLRAKAEAIARAHLEKKGVVEGAAAPGAEPRAERPVDPMARTRVACTKCETSNEPDAAFCKKCGLRLARVECPSCAVSNEPDATFCKKCGTSLASAGEQRTEGKDATG